MSAMSELDGKPVEMASILSDPALAPLGSHHGKMTVLRQPGVPSAPLVELLFPSIEITGEFETPVP